MSAAGSLVGRKRERPAHSPGPKGAAGQEPRKGARKGSRPHTPPVRGS